MKTMLLTVSCLMLLVSGALAQASDLFISEYIEGSSNNKALEIYNGTEAAINMSEYVVERYSNGGTTPVTISLIDIVVEPGDVFVIANPSAVAAILDVADQTSGDLNFNGDDALVLVKGGAVVDRFGQRGFDPGSAWECANGSTANHTLRRMNDICDGDTDPDAVFDPCDEYDFYPSDTFDGLGAHVADCGSVGNGNTTWGALKAEYR